MEQRFIQTIYFSKLFIQVNKRKLPVMFHRAGQRGKTAKFCCAAAKRHQGPRNQAGGFY